MPKLNATGTTIQPGPRLIDGSELLAILNGDRNFSGMSIGQGGLMWGSSADNLTASTVQTLAGALQLSQMFNRVTTANNSDAVKLPASTGSGLNIAVTNDSGQTIQVFPFEATATIDSGAAGASVNISNGKRVEFWTSSAGVWISQASTKTT